MKAMHKDFWMEIRKSKARFISIFMIVALGVAFFSGIQASSPDMRFSGDAYYDETNLMDIKVMGTLGLTEDDVAAIKQVDGVENAECIHVGKQWEIAIPKADLPAYNNTLSFGLYLTDPYGTFSIFENVVDHLVCRGCRLFGDRKYRFGHRIVTVQPSGFGSDIKGRIPGDE